MSFRIKTVAAMTGIPRPTLLAWERRYQVLDPERTAGGFRMYTEHDVEVLRRLKAMVDAGHAISEAVSLVRAGRAPEVEPELPPAVPTGLEDRTERLARALEAFDRPAALQVVRGLAPLSFEQQITSVYLPLLRATGDRWARGEVTVAQEHFLSEFCREQLWTMFHAIEGGPREGRSIACVTPPGERHDIGLLATAVRRAIHGDRVSWLGADIPVGDLCAYLRQQKPAVLVIGVTFGRSTTDVLQFAREVRACAPLATEIVVGGPGVGELAGLSEPRIRIVGTLEEV